MPDGPGWWANRGWQQNSLLGLPKGERPLGVRQGNLFGTPIFPDRQDVRTLLRRTGLKSLDKDEINSYSHVPFIPEADVAAFWKANFRQGAGLVDWVEQARKMVIAWKKEPCLLLTRQWEALVADRNECAGSVPNRLDLPKPIYDGALWMAAVAQEVLDVRTYEGPHVAGNYIRGYRLEHGQEAIHLKEHGRCVVDVHPLSAWSLDERQVDEAQGVVGTALIDVRAVAYQMLYPIPGTGPSQPFIVVASEREQVALVCVAEPGDAGSDRSRSSQ